MSQHSRYTRRSLTGTRVRQRRRLGAVGRWVKGRVPRHALRPPSARAPGCRSALGLWALRRQQTQGTGPGVFLWSVLALRRQYTQGTGPLGCGAWLHDPGAGLCRPWSPAPLTEPKRRFWVRHGTPACPVAPKHIRSRARGFSSWPPPKHEGIQTHRHILMEVLCRLHHRTPTFFLLVFCASSSPLLIPLRLQSGSACRAAGSVAQGTGLDEA